jgi:relaxase-like protein
MILKGAQRGGAAQLAGHLLKTDENEHVEVYELDGFIAEDLHAALQEIYAVSRGTRCQQFMFSVSLNPPQNESVPVEYFEKAIKDIEKELGLEGQPRAVVFHEKEGRRHCHAVWSRIDIDQMKAINLPYYKMKLQDISRQLYFQYGWQMPKGLLHKQERNPLNYSLAQWQQAKRAGEDPKLLQKLFQDCWAVSDNKKSFEQALKEYGLYLAKGDRRGFVAIDYRGEVYSLSKWLKVKTKSLKERLGDPETIPSTKEVKAKIAERMTEKLKTYAQEVQAQLKQQVQPFIQKKRSLQHQHQNERERLQHKQEERWQQESIARSQRLPKGIKGIWFRITGKYQKIRGQNEAETEKYRIRDKDQKQNLIERQLIQRQKLQDQVRPIIEEHKVKMLGLKQDIARYLELGGSPPKTLLEEFTNRHKDRDIDYTPEL